MKNVEYAIAREEGKLANLFAAQQELDEIGSKFVEVEKVIAEKLREDDEVFEAAKAKQFELAELFEDSFVRYMAVKNELSEVKRKKEVERMAIKNNKNEAARLEELNRLFGKDTSRVLLPVEK